MTEKVTATPNPPDSGVAVTVPGSPSEVFAFIATPDNDPIWVCACQTTRLLTQGPLAAGSRVWERIRFGGLPFTYEWEVTRFVPGHLLTYTSRRGLVPMVITIEVLPKSEGAEVRQTIDLHLPALLPFRTALARLIGTREARRNLASLKRYFAESGRDPNAV
jgi:uncharacterized protein YndB with AHSA1/START domain